MEIALFICSEFDAFVSNSIRLIKRALARKSIATLRCGTLYGYTLSGIHYFRGVPYATLSTPVSAPELLSEDANRVIPARWDGPMPLQPESYVQILPPYLLNFILSFGKKMYTRFLMRCTICLYGSSRGCLTLHIAKPDRVSTEANRGLRSGGGLYSSSEKPLPVMVWFHGGAFAYGTANDPMFDPTSLARRGVIVVSVNARLGVMGYLEVEGAPGNRGLLDQLMALRWVQRNIADLGGDPHNVTIFGESAGAMACTALLGSVAIRSEGLFRRVILQSGAHQCFHTKDEARVISSHALRSHNSTLEPSLFTYQQQLQHRTCSFHHSPHLCGRRSSAWRNQARPPDLWIGGGWDKVSSWVEGFSP